MPYTPNYPATVAEILTDHKKYNPVALAAVRALKRAKPWQGTLEERQAKVQTCLKALALAYDLPCPRLRFQGGEGSSGASSYCPATHTITLRGRLSVVTFLHEFAHARGADERQAVRWSVNLFRRLFPRSFARCVPVGHTLIRP